MSRYRFIMFKLPLVVIIFLSVLYLAFILIYMHEITQQRSLRLVETIGHWYVKNGEQSHDTPRPWFMINGTQWPSQDETEDVDLLFPNNASSSGDRVIEQLMFVPRNYNDKLLVNNGKRARKLKQILLNMATGGWNILRMKLGQAAFAGCPVNACELIYSFDKAETADAVIFKDKFFTPNFKRPIGQVWVFHSLESPLNAILIDDAKNKINWTATFRFDSDIVMPYGKFVTNYSQSPKSSEGRSTRNYAKGKTKKVAWFLSNCFAKNNRMQYAKELEKYIQVDIFGGCGDKICPRSEHARCIDMLNRDYKFYLSFENSNCRGYITEKFFAIGLGNDVLPIVMGAPMSDYIKLAPNHSFIHVDEFKSPKHLASYLHQLDQNDTLYNAYFDWKGTGEFIDTHFWCRLCSLLHSNYREKVYQDFKQWWLNDDICPKRMNENWRQFLDAHQDANNVSSNIFEALLNHLPTKKVPASSVAALAHLPAIAI